MICFTRNLYYQNWARGQFETLPQPSSHIRFIIKKKFLRDSLMRPSVAFITYVLKRAFRNLRNVHNTGDVTLKSDTGKCVTTIFTPASCV